MSRRHYLARDVGYACFAVNALVWIVVLLFAVILPVMAITIVFAVAFRILVVVLPILGVASTLFSGKERWLICLSLLSPAYLGWFANFEGRVSLQISGLLFLISVVYFTLSLFVAWRWVTGARRGYLDQANPHLPWNHSQTPRR